jgi:hypothetical protein
MTGFAEAGNMPMSILTLGGLHDLGFQVDETKADVFEAPVGRRRRLRGKKRQLIGCIEKRDFFKELLDTRAKPGKVDAYAEEKERTETYFEFIKQMLLEKKKRGKEVKLFLSITYSYLFIN